MFPLYAWNDWVLLMLRFAMGIIMLWHGIPKVGDLKKTIQNFNQMGFRPGFFWGTLVAFLEFFGGLALVFGFYTQCVAALFVLEFLTILIWKFKNRAPFIGGSEFDLILFAAALSLVVMGPGMLSLDFLFGVI